MTTTDVTRTKIKTRQEINAEVDRAAGHGSLNLLVRRLTRSVECTNAISTAAREAAHHLRYDSKSQWCENYYAWRIQQAIDESSFWKRLVRRFRKPPNK